MRIFSLRGRADYKRQIVAACAHLRGAVPEDEGHCKQESNMTDKPTSSKPKIAVFSGPTATIQNSEPLVTSNKARQKYGLPLRANPDGTPSRFDALRPQRLAAPVTVYIE